tara:strand:+ start:1141 stop:1305 length:165 start_codon:yes stop_codon:yes gene_type:complete
MKNLLKTWDSKELNKTLVSYSKRVKEYQPQERNDFYYRMQKQIILLNAEINSRN